MVVALQSSLKPPQPLYWITSVMTNVWKTERSISKESVKIKCNKGSICIFLRDYIRCSNKKLIELDSWREVIRIRGKFRERLIIFL